MSILLAKSVTIYDGPNLFAKGPVLKYVFEVDVRSFPDPGDFAQKLCEAGKIDFRPEAKDFPDFLICSALVQISAKLMKTVCGPIADGYVQQEEDTGYFTCYVPFTVNEVCRRVMFLLYGLFNELTPDEFEDSLAQFAQRLEAIQQEASVLNKRLSLGRPVIEFIKLAEQRSIPWRKVSANQKLVFFGYGRNRKICDRSIVHQESHIAASAANNKEQTQKLMSLAGLPVAPQQVVRSEQQALQAAKRIGLPVAVKPLFGLQGFGITPKANSLEEVKGAFHRASKYHQHVLIEEHITGEDYRFHIVGGQFELCIRRNRANVTGNGQDSIRVLVEKANEADWRKGPDGKLIFGIPISEDTTRNLEKQELNWSTIPDDGQIIYLQQVPNLSQGGNFDDVTDQVHPDNISMAERAAVAIGLQVAGVDFLTEDITRPYWETEGRICEVNVMPAIFDIERPGDQKLQQFKRVFELMWPQGDDAQIPIVAILSNGTSRVSYWLQAIFDYHGLTVGLQNDENAFVGPSPLVGLGTPPDAAKAILWNPSVDVALLQNSVDTIYNHGLGFEQADYLILDEGIDLANEQTQAAASLLTRVCKKGILYSADKEADAEWTEAQSDRERFGINGKAVSQDHFNQLPDEEKRPCLMAIQCASLCGMAIGNDCLMHLVYLSRQDELNASEKTAV
ncbi:hypothetical protein [Sneathiella sp.]|uniref:ATP-binding protein n=1 Tax=Sneathiella sp. TaxID=1964365 RepID=UPI0039E64393